MKLHVLVPFVAATVFAACQSAGEDDEDVLEINRVLVIGNSITYHPIAPDIGWHADWGMAASARENDFCSLLEASLLADFPELAFMRENVYPFERHYDDLDFEQYAYLKEFAADLLVIRLGENVNTDKLEGWNFSERLQAFTDYLTGETGARIIVTTTFWENAVVNEQLLHAAGVEGWETVSLSHLGEDEQYMAIGAFENPDVARHPNDKGMRAIANLILQSILARG
ncbi:hypothetical protein [Negadavirga shengliensis]|uniref:SGNH/GDSL hydrolase family protein n=1 Tax=Negadavirga shengliensis TaxID=1389218 RepID=A0ABV9SVV1_9BACT